jgi:hypothetical protein
VGLTQFEMGEKVIFANGSRAALLYFKRGILQHSSILIKVNLPLGCRIAALIHSGIQSVFACARINSEDYPLSLLLMTSSGCFIGTVQNLDKMHIRTVSTSPCC